MEETPAGPKHADLSFLKVYSGGNADLIRQLVNQFVERTPASIVQMEDAFGKSDFHTLSRVAHSLKSQVSYMGAKTANELIVEIEHDAKEGKRLELLPQKISALREMLAATYSELLNQIQQL